MSCVHICDSGSISNPDQIKGGPKHTARNSQSLWEQQPRQQLKAMVAATSWHLGCLSSDALANSCGRRSMGDTEGHIAIYLFIYIYIHMFTYLFSYSIHNVKNQDDVIFSKF